jgi:hypothetical protein
VHIYTTVRLEKREETRVNLLDVSAILWRNRASYILAVRPVVDVAFNNTMPALPIAVMVEHRTHWSIDGKLRDYNYEDHEEEEERSNSPPPN